MISLSNNNKTVDLVKCFSRNLAFRDNARNLFAAINNSDLDEIILNFQDIEAISRSFAHEILVKLRETEKKVIIENIPPDVQKMMDLVKNHESWPLL